MRILVLAQYYDPVPVPKPGEVARWLAARGHEVSVLTGLPNYPSGVLAPGYRIVPFMRERRDGLLVRRVYELPYHGTSAAGRMLNYGSFLVAGALASSVVTRPDAVYVWHPPLNVGVIASLLSRWRGVPFVYDVQDIWPDSALMSGMLSEGRLATILRRVETWAYGHAAHILVVTDGAKSNLAAKGVPVSKVSVLPHWADPLCFIPPADDARLWAREFLHHNDRFIVTFAGNLGLLQGLDVLLQAAKKLLSSPRVAFRIVGDGADRRRLEQMSDQLGLTNVEFLGARPSTDMPAVFAESDALLVQLRGGPLSDLIVPSKTQAYLAAGRPIVAALSGPSAAMVLRAGAGVVVPPDDPDGLAAAVDELSRSSRVKLSEMGDRGRAYAERNFSKDDVMRQIEELLRAVARR
ncbi:MAG: glycosyltransferase family 4 protein [Actinomycetota bacterium]|nr:glycosyltransferase family 4 protein [Actinomycetota bacterium]